MPTVFERALEMHEKNKGKISIVSKVKVANKDDLSLAYSPGVAEPCRKIAENEKSYDSRKPVVVRLLLVFRSSSHSHHFAFLE